VNSTKVSRLASSMSTESHLLSTIHLTFLPGCNTDNLFSKKKQRFYHLQIDIAKNPHLMRRLLSNPANLIAD
jgi:hypothetical protein